MKFQIIPIEIITITTNMVMDIIYFVIIRLKTADYDWLVLN